MAARGRLGPDVYRLFRGHTYVRTHTEAAPSGSARQDEIHYAIQSCWYYYYNTALSRATWPAWMRNWIDYDSWPQRYNQSLLLYAQYSTFPAPPYQQYVRMRMQELSNDIHVGHFFFARKLVGYWGITILNREYEPTGNYPRPLTLLTGTAPDHLTPWQTMTTWHTQNGFQNRDFVNPPASHTCWQLLAWGRPYSGIFTAPPAGLNH